MIRKIVSIGFLLLYLAFLILPAYPVMHYYFLSSGNSFSSASQQRNYSSADHTKTGDVAYLSALLKSAADKNNEHQKAQNPPPSTNNEINNLVYVVTGNFHLSLVTPGIPLHFPVFSEPLPMRYLQVLIPPPNPMA